MTWKRDKFDDTNTRPCTRNFWEICFFVDVFLRTRIHDRIYELKCVDHILKRYQAIMFSTYCFLFINNDNKLILYLQT